MTKKMLIALSMLLILSSSVMAVDKGPIELKSVAEVEITVTNSKGEKEIKRVEASKANITPGDTVIFTNYYINKGDKPATNVVIINPVPEHMVYVENSAEGKDAKIEFSVDNGKSYALPQNLVIKGKDGKERPATASDYTHIKWTIEKPIEKGAKGSVSFKAKVK